MIVWCAYCQTYQGEIAPIDDWAASHGICPQCKSRGIMHDPGAVDAILPVVKLYRRLYQSLKERKISEATVIVSEGLTLGLDPCDLLMGFLQPALYQVGKLWCENDLLVAEEHEFTRFCRGFLRDLSQEKNLSQLQQRKDAAVALFNANDNYHSVGVELLEVFLSLRGIPNFCLSPGLPSQEITTLALQIRPRVLGVSVGDAAQLSQLREISQALSLHSFRGRLLVGGFPIRNQVMIPEDSGFAPVRDIRELTQILGNP